MEVIGVVGVAAIIWYGGYLVIAWRDDARGVLFLSHRDVYGLYADPQLSGANNTIQQALSAAERVFDVLDLETEQEPERGALALPGITRSVGVSRSDVPLRRPWRARHRPISI